MAYDKQLAMCYNFAEMDFGAASGATVHTICGPLGKQGRLLDIAVATSEVFACDATVASVAVGTSADADAYGLLNIADGTADNAVFNSVDDTDAVIAADIPANTAIHVTLTEGTDSTAVTGKGFPMVFINWF
jgi:hypothetical protein